MDKKFLELDERKALLFEYSKEEKEGFEKHTPENGKSSYRKYYNEGVKGTLKYINEREEEFKTGKVKKLQLIVDNGNTRYYMSFNILTSNGNLGQFVEQFIPILPNLKQNESYRFYPYEMETEYVNKEGETKKGVNKGVSVYTWDLENDTKLVKVEKAHSFAKDGDIPAIVWTKVTKMGATKNVKDDTERLNFLYDVMVKSLTPQTGKKEETSQEVPKTENKPIKESAPKFEDEEHEDLPF